jgi:ABC-2 type transport system ATP-binding protein
MEEAENCDELGLIYRGRLIAQGTPATIRTESMPEDILEIRLDRTFDALEKLEHSGMVRHAALFGDALHAVVENAQQASPVVKEYLAKEGFDVELIAAVTPSLEDVFVSLIEQEDRKTAVGNAA